MSFFTGRGAKKSNVEPAGGLTRTSASSSSFNWDTFYQIQFSMILFWVVVVVSGVAVISVLYWCLLYIKARMLATEREKSKIRFRKRDKVMFYGKKMLRKVKTFTKNNVLVPRGRMKKRQLVLKLAKRLLQRKRETQPLLVQKEPPRSFLEVDSSEQDDSEYRLPPDVLYMLRSVRVFGHFQQDLFLELCRHLERKSIPAHTYLFRVGDHDDSIYVVESGKINVYITESDGNEYLVKEVQTGDSIHSLLSIVDVLTGHPSPFKTVTAKAMEDTHVLKLPVQSFQSVFDMYPDSLVRVVQIIMVRLQRVTFLALHKYLGLSTELINPATAPEEDIKSLNIYSLSSQGSGSPYRSTNIKDTHSTPSLTISTSESMNDVAGISAEKISSHSLGDSGTYSRSQLSHSISEEESYDSMNFENIYMNRRISSSGYHRTVPGGLAPVRLSDDELELQRMNIRRHGSDPMGYSLTMGRTLIDQKKMELVKQDLTNLFKLKDPNLLDGKLTLKQFRPGSILQKQGDQDSSLFFIITGTLNVLQNIVGHEEKETLLFSAGLGRVVGALAVLTGEPSMFTVKSKTESEVVLITKIDFYSIMKKQPSIVLQAAHTIVRRMSSFVRQIDFALDWTMLEAGRALFRQEEPCNSIYIILTGRLRSIITSTNDKKELVGEYGRGDLVGIVEALTQTQRATTVMAVRDTELADIPAELLNHIKRKYPQIVTRLIHLLGQRLLGNLQNRTTDQLKMESRMMVSNLSTIAIVPISNDVPLENFTRELQHALNAIGPTARITSEIVRNSLGNAAFNSLNDFRLFSWLSQHEDINRMVLYQCDNTMNWWTKHFVRQADCILIVGVATNDASVLGELECQLENITVRAQKELILLHREDADTPRRTADWLNARGWCSSHHHIRCPKRVFSRKSKEKTNEVYARLFESEPDKLSDFSRLARFLTGTSIGLVLGGGGARGISHMGMIRAMTESGIPIDMVGGTSIGSIMGAIWAESRDVTRSVQRAREWSKEMTSLWKKILDLTYPVTSMFTGSGFNKSLENVFRDRQIEDLWIPYFCITTDISASSMRVHTTGSLWRYVRASMSLSGYLPPLCDPIDGHLLLDGGYVNNLPADVMRAKGAQSIFAVDVGSQDEDELTNYGDELSGWWLLWKRWNPWSKSVKVPDMTEIQSRLAYVSCVRQLELVKTCDYCEYMRPPIDKYKTLQFGSFDEIYDVGYNHFKAWFRGWIKGGLHKELFIEKTEERPSKKKHSPMFPPMPTMANFTDLAELVSKIEDYTVNCSCSESEDMLMEDLDMNPVYASSTSVSSNEAANLQDYDEVSDDEHLLPKPRHRNVKGAFQNRKSRTP